MKTLKKSQRISAVILSILMILFTVNCGAVSAYASEKDSESTLTLDVTNSSISFRENATTGENEYRENQGAWTPYSGKVIITGSTNNHSIEVSSGEHDIILSNVNINIPEEVGMCAFQIFGNAVVNLTLEENTNNVLKSGYGLAGIQVEEAYNQVATINIGGSGKLSATGGSKGAGIGGNVGANGYNGSPDGSLNGSHGYNGANGGNINISDSAQVVATGGYGAAGIGGGAGGNGGNGGNYYSDEDPIGGNGGDGGNGGSGGNINISENSNVTAIGGVNASGIGGASGGNGGNAGDSKEGGEIVIPDDDDDDDEIDDEDFDDIPVPLNNIEKSSLENYQINDSIGSNGGNGGNGGDGGNITIEDTAFVASSTSTSNSQEMAIGNGLAGSGGLNDSCYIFGIHTEKGESGLNGSGADLKIGKNAKVVATGNNSDKMPINDSDNKIEAPQNEQAANLLCLNYKNTIPANTTTSIFSDAGDMVEYAPLTKYDTIVFSGVELNEDYYVKCDGNYQANIKDEHKFRCSEEITVVDGLHTTSTIDEFDISNSSLMLKEKDGLSQYSTDGTNWDICSNTISIKGSTNVNTITVLSGSFNILFDGVNIDVSAINDKCAFSVEGDSTVNLTLVNNSENTLKSGKGKAGIQVQSYDDKIATLNIGGSGTINATGGYKGAGIGGNSGVSDSIYLDGNPTAENGRDAGVINIFDNVTINATAGMYAAGIGGGSSYFGSDAGDGGKVTIGGTSQVTAIGGNHGAGIGGAGAQDTNYNTGGSDAGNGDMIVIKDNATVNAFGGEDAAGLGGGAGAYGYKAGYGGNGGIVIISDNTNVTVTGGTNAPAIGGGKKGRTGYPFNEIHDGYGADIKIGSNAIVTAVSSSTSKPAIDDSNGVIEAPEGEVASNILELNYENKVSADATTIVRGLDGSIHQYAPTKEYQSIAFSGLNTGVNYIVSTDGINQMGNLNSSFDVANEFYVNSGLTIYNHVKPNI